MLLVTTLNIIVLGPVSAANLTATGNSEQNSFSLVVIPPTTSPYCILGFRIVIRQDGELIANRTFPISIFNYSLTTDLKRAIGSDVQVFPCKHMYTFELFTSFGKNSSGKQPGIPNLSGNFFLASIFYDDQTYTPVLLSTVLFTGTYRFNYSS